MARSDGELLEIGLGIATAMRLAMTITVEEAELYAVAAAANRERTHSAGPILDPTLYRREGPRADASANMARAFLDFRKAIEANRAPPELAAEQCPACGGSGRYVINDPADPETCERCSGRGSVSDPRRRP